jgi:hypothetical protein
MATVTLQACGNLTTVKSLYSASELARRRNRNVFKDALTKLLPFVLNRRSR